MMEGVRSQDAGANTTGQETNYEIPHDYYNVGSDVYENEKGYEQIGNHQQGVDYDEIPDYLEVIETPHNDQNQNGINKEQVKKQVQDQEQSGCPKWLKYIIVIIIVIIAIAVAIVVVVLKGMSILSQNSEIYIKVYFYLFFLKPAE